MKKNLRSTEQKYTALRTIASATAGIGLFFGGFIIVVGVIISVIAINNENFLMGFSGAIASIVIGGFISFILKVISESIMVLLDIESNTRDVVAVLDGIY